MPNHHKEMHNHKYCGHPGYQFSAYRLISADLHVRPIYCIIFIMTTALASSMSWSQHGLFCLPVIQSQCIADLRMCGQQLELNIISTHHLWSCTNKDTDPQSQSASYRSWFSEVRYFCNLATAYDMIRTAAFFPLMISKK